MSIKKLTANQRGFTLIELLVVMVIMGVLSVLLANFITIWLGSATKAQAQSALLNNAESALDTVTNDVMLSGSVDENNRWPDQNASSGQYSWQSASQTLVLATVATDKYNNIIYSDPSDYVSEKNDEVYFLSGSTLYRRTLADPNDSTDSAVTTCPASDASSSCPADLQVATGVSNISFSYYDANENQVTPSDARSVQVSITLSGQQNGHSVNATYSTRMVFRNE